jgi:anti-sigma regulatory factor (Ser/Thr protein kinase)
MNSYEKSKYSQVTLVDLATEENAQRIQIYKLVQTRAVMAKIENWMRVLSYSHRDIFAVALVFHEAMTNSLRHGHHNDASKPVQVTYLVTPDDVLLEIQDQGEGFDHKAEAEFFTEKPLERRRCRGLFLMRVYSSWLNFAGSGNRVTLCRRRTQV